MTTYAEVAQALANAGYLSDADLEAAAAVLQDALIIADSEEAEAAAMDDYSDQEDRIAKAEVWKSEDGVQGYSAEESVDEDILADAKIKKEIDKEVVLASEAFIDVAYTDAAAALLAAELIDAANAEAVAAAIADAWVE